MVRRIRWRGAAVLAASSLCLSGLGTTWIGSRHTGVQNGDVRMVGLAASKKAAIEEAEKTLEEFKEMKKDYEKMRTRPQPRNGKRVGNEVWFDVKLSPPLGLALDTSVDGEAVGVSEVVEGGSAFEYNKNCLRQDAEEKRIWIQPGDRVLMVNGVKTKTTEEVVGVVSKMKEGEKVVLKLSRQARGPIQVVFPEPADPVVVRGSTKLVDAARAAGHEVIYRCEDGLCGSCWHVSELTGDIYQLCIETSTAASLPSKAASADFGEQIGGVVSALSGNNQWKPGESWDNTEPLRLRPCPEIYEKFMNPHLGKWQYNAGSYKVTRDDEDRLIYVENNVEGFLEPEDDDDPTNRWLKADLAEHGEIRIRLSKSLGISIDMESQYKPQGSDEWGEIRTAFKY